jgi:hypothetical protein
VRYIGDSGYKSESEEAHEAENLLSSLWSAANRDPANTPLVTFTRSFEETDEEKPSQVAAAKPASTAPAQTPAAKPASTAAAQTPAAKPAQTAAAQTPAAKPASTAPASKKAKS